MKKNFEKLLIIDSNSVIHRAFHALPFLTTKKGEIVNAVYGFLLIFFKVIKDFQPEYIAATFDLPTPTFRHKKFKEYKAKRPPTPENLPEQILKIKEIIKLFNVPIFEKKGFEADDIIGTITSFSEIENIVLSGDLDLLQLINLKTKVCFLRKGVKDIVLYNEESVKERYKGLSSSQILDFKSLKGDSSDNISGVTGIGEKTAINLLLEFNNLNNLYKEIKEDSLKIKKINPRIRDILIKNKKQAFFSREMIEIKRDVPFNFEIEKCSWVNYDKKIISEALKKLEFNSLVDRLPQFLDKDNLKDTKNLTLW